MILLALQFSLYLPDILFHKSVVAVLSKNVYKKTSWGEKATKLLCFCKLTIFKGFHTYLNLGYKIGSQMLTLLNIICAKMLAPTKPTQGEFHAKKGAVI